MKIGFKLFEFLSEKFILEEATVENGRVLCLSKNKKEFKFSLEYELRILFILKKNNNPLEFLFFINLFLQENLKNNYQDELINFDIKAIDANNSLLNTEIKIIEDITIEPSNNANSFLINDISYSFGDRKVDLNLFTKIKKLKSL